MTSKDDTEIFYYCPCNNIRVSEEDFLSGFKVCTECRKPLEKRGVCPKCGETFWVDKGHDCVR